MITPEQQKAAELLGELLDRYDKKLLGPEEIKGFRYLCVEQMLLNPNPLSRRVFYQSAMLDRPLTNKDYGTACMFVIRQEQLTHSPE